MKILFAADGSPFTKKALAYLVTNPEMLAGGELAVLHVQPPLPPRVTSMVGTRTVADYQKEEAEAILAPIEAFLRRHPLQFTVAWKVGAPAETIVETARAEHARLIVMGTHGHGLLGRALMGSVAQKVLHDADIPVLLVK